MWIKTVSEHQNPAELWLADIMADHYEDKHDTPEWFDTDDGHRKANWKEPVARALVRDYGFERLADDETPDDTPTVAETLDDPDGPDHSAAEESPD